MNNKTTLVAAVVLVGLAAYIYRYEREPVPVSPETKREKVFSFDESKVKSVAVEREGELQLRIERGGSGWQITAPTEAPADLGEADTLARNLATLERERVVAETGANLADFGLDRPSLTLHFEVEGDTESDGLLIGAKSPTGSNVYAKVLSEEKVFVIPSYLESSFDKKPWDVRDKVIFHFDRGDVEKLTFRSTKGELTLAKASEDLWNVTTPSICRADKSKANGLVSRFETARMDEIVSETGDNLKAYGLDKPQYQVDIQLKGGRARRMDIGKEKDSTRYYAKNPARPVVYLLASSLVGDVKKDFTEYRSKRLFDYSTYQVGKLQIAAAGEAPRVVEKTREKDEDKWRETAPSAAAKDLDRNVVEDFLYKMNGTDADSFAADRLENAKAYGLDAPLVTITVWSNEGKNVEELAVGKAGDAVYARRKGDDPVLQIGNSAWQDIEKLMALQPKKEDTGAAPEAPKEEVRK